MAPLPKRRHSSRRSGKRKKSLAFNPVRLTICPNCGQTKIPHAVCPACGFYNTRLVVPPKKEKKKASR